MKIQLNSALVLAALTLVSGRKRFLAAEFGNFPDCDIFGRTYCQEIADYPYERIGHLVHNRLFNLSALILSEGDPDKYKVTERSTEETNAVISSGDHYQSFLQKTVDDHDDEEEEERPSLAISFDNNEEHFAAPKRKRKIDQHQVQAGESSSVSLSSNNNLNLGSSDKTVNEVASTNFEPPLPPQSQNFAAFLDVEAAENPTPQPDVRGTQSTHAQPQYIPSDYTVNYRQREKQQESQSDNDDDDRHRLTATVVEVRSSVSDEQDEAYSTPEPPLSTLKPKPTTYRILSRPGSVHRQEETKPDEKKRRKKRKKRPRIYSQIRAQKAKIARLLMAALKNESLAEHNPSKQDLAILKAQIQKLRSNLAPKTQLRRKDTFEGIFPPTTTEKNSVAITRASTLRTTTTTTTTSAPKKKLIPFSPLTTQPPEFFKLRPVQFAELFANGLKSTSTPRSVSSLRPDLPTSIPAASINTVIRMTTDYNRQVTEGSVPYQPNYVDVMPEYMNNDQDEERLAESESRVVKIGVGIQPPKRPEPQIHYGKPHPGILREIRPPPPGNQYDPRIDDAVNFNKAGSVVARSSLQVVGPAEQSSQIVVEAPFKPPKQQQQQQQHSIPFRPHPQSGFEQRRIRLRPQTQPFRAHEQRRVDVIHADRPFRASPSDIGKPPLNKAPRHPPRNRYRPRKLPANKRPSYRHAPQPPLNAKRLEQSQFRRRRLRKRRSSTACDEEARFERRMLNKGRTHLSENPPVLRGHACPATKIYVHPKVAFSVHGEWLYIVNLPGNVEYQQGILTVECQSPKCQSCSREAALNSSDSGAKCDLTFVQKRLIALDPSGQRLINEIFWLPAMCLCQTNQ